MWRAWWLPAGDMRLASPGGGVKLEEAVLQRIIQLHDGGLNIKHSRTTPIIHTHRTVFLLTMANIAKERLSYFYVNEIY